LAVEACGELELAFNGDECSVEELAAVPQRFLDHCLAVQEQQVKRKDANLDLHIFNLDILLLPRHQLLEW
jgi:hypothetical protein